MNDLTRMKLMLKDFGALFTEQDNFGETNIYVGGIQDSGATCFVFNSDSGKYLRYDTPLVDSCLTRRM